MYICNIHPRYFRGSGGELPPEMAEGGSETLNKSKVKKKKSSGTDWTWKGQGSISRNFISAENYLDKFYL
jgi:hypothetical protein